MKYYVLLCKVIIIIFHCNLMLHLIDDLVSFQTLGFNELMNLELASLILYSSAVVVRTSPVVQLQSNFHNQLVSTPLLTRSERFIKKNQMIRKNQLDSLVSSQ